MSTQFGAEKLMMANENILVVEDEEDVQELIRYNLERERYQVDCVGSGEHALVKARGAKPDLILLDLMLPGIGGLEVCRRLKGDPSTAFIPIIIVSARGEESDIVSGLELGAEDYISKPFSPRILLARLRVVLRRRKIDEPAETDLIRKDSLVIDPVRFEVAINDAPISLTVTEFKILHFLALRPGWVFTRDQIINAIKGDNYPVTARSVDVQVVGLRKKLGEGGDRIETVRGVGYRFKE
jgi:two-component system alkaline phosphatase synthesis response regulator PhoP